MISENFLIGTDPEFFAVDNFTGESRSLIGYIDGTKADPVEIGNGCRRLLDNVAVEFNVPPSKEYGEILESVKYCVKYTNDSLKHNHLKLVYRSSLRFDPLQLNSEAAREFGCSPSISIYDERPHKVKLRPEFENLRSAGYHLHFGWEDIPTEGELKDFIFLCDLFLGIPSLEFDKDEERRKLYGRFGDYRLTSYGVEYRTLGANMFLHEDVIYRGLENIKNNLNNIESIKADFYAAAKAMALSNIRTYKQELIDKFKMKRK